MTDLHNVESLVLEHLRAIRADLADVKDRLTGVEVQLSAMGQQLAGLTTAVYSGKSDTDSFRRRLERIERRLAAMVRWPYENGEGLQVLRYRHGAQYVPHYDYFDPAQPGTPRILQRGGQRVGTIVMYLRTPERGGATVFPDVGLEVAPIKGSAVFFSYDRPHPDTKTLHGGSPVTLGEKYVATKWMRAGEFV